MRPVAPEKPLTQAAFAKWTLATVVSLGLGLGAIEFRVFWLGLIGLMALLVVAGILSWTGPFTRILPGLLGAAIVGIVPLYRGLVSGNWKPGEAYLGIAGFFAAILVTFSGFELAKRRWGVDSPARRRVLSVSVVAWALVTVPAIIFKEEIGAWRNVPPAAWLVVLLLANFWPLRKQPPHAPPPATV